MPATTEVLYIASLQRAAAFFRNNGPMGAWSLFAGTGLAHKLQEVLWAFYSEKYNVDFSSSTSVLSEKKDLKQDFPARAAPDNADPQR